MQINDNAVLSEAVIIVCFSYSSVLQPKSRFSLTSGAG